MRRPPHRSSRKLVTSSSNLNIDRMERLQLLDCTLTHVRIREFVTRFTRFSLEIWKTILFFFWSILQEILEAKRINKEEEEGSMSRTLETDTTGTPVDTLRTLVEFCWHQWIPFVHSLSFVGSRSRINPTVKYGGYLPIQKIRLWSLSGETDGRKLKNEEHPNNW